jgi:hypothetical protein
MLDGKEIYVMLSHILNSIKQERDTNRQRSLEHYHGQQDGRCNPEVSSGNQLVGRVRAKSWPTSAGPAQIQLYTYTLTPKLGHPMERVRVLHHLQKPFQTAQLPTASEYPMALHSTQHSKFNYLTLTISRKKDCM